MDLKELYRELTGRDPGDMAYASIIQNGIPYEINFYNATGQKLCLQAHATPSLCLVFEDDAAPPSAGCEVFRFSKGMDIGGFVLKVMKRHSEMVEDRAHAGTKL